MLPPTARKTVPSRNSLEPLPLSENPIHIRESEIRVYPARKTVPLRSLNSYSCQVFGYAEGGEVLFVGGPGAADDVCSHGVS